MYSYNDRVSFSRIDKDGQMGVSNIVDALQDACMFHGEDEGHSALRLLEKDRAWLVSSWHVVFCRRPILGEYFTVHTWPYRFRGVFGKRNFLMETPKKERLAYADSTWFYFDSKKGAPARVDAEEQAVYPLEPAYDMEYSSRKVRVPENLSAAGEISVCQNYLDTNNHVNNGQYVRLAVNALPIDYPVSEFRAEFRLAAKMGDTLYVRTGSCGEFFYVVLTDQDGSPYFISEFKELSENNLCK